MRSYVLIAVVMGGAGAALSADEPNLRPDAPWSLNATIIEACSCPMFCQCYFNEKPAAHGAHAAHGQGEHFCRFNNAYKVNKGQWGDIKLEGAKFWLYGDLGGDFSKGKMDWAVLTFDPSVQPQQRLAIRRIIEQVYPAAWNSFTVAPDAPIEWNASRDAATAKLDGGRIAEVSLKRFQGMSDEPVVIRNLKYWGAPRNEGLLLMPNVVEALRAAPEGRQPYEFKGTNGFMVTFDIASTDLAKPAAMSAPKQ